MNLWRLSRYWNRLMFFIMRIARAGIWDYSGSNGDYLDELWSPTAEDILCHRVDGKSIFTIAWKRRKREARGG